MNKARSTSAVLIFCLWSSIAIAQPKDTVDCADSVQCLREQLAALRRETQQQINDLDSRINKLDTGQAARVANTSDIGQTDRRVASSNESNRLRITGDLRLRYENTSSHTGLPERNRGVIRTRLAASYFLNDTFTLGARLATGDPDDPNSTDVSMGNFVDDLEVSLDRAYVSFRGKNLLAAGGKIANPFARTDLVWDSDVSPYGVSGEYTFHDSQLYTTRFTTLYALIDEQLIANDSTMKGGQLSVEMHPSENWSIGLDTGYYDYTIGSLNNADQGDIRGNILVPAGNAYISDFDLLNAIATLEYKGFGADWPIVVVADYVRNLGAQIPEDSGYSIDLLLGDVTETGNWRFRYGFSVAETDAVFAAFSHDNTTYSTNYRQHTLGVDYVPLENVNLNLTNYIYRRDTFDPIAQPGAGNYVSRIRLNLRLDF